MTHGSLFSGRGGFDCAAASVGLTNVFNCEIDRWLRSKLKQMHPDAHQYGNVKTIKYAPFVNILSAGFPCQDISIANKNAEGITGIRSGLFSEVKRIAAETQPEYIILENSPELLKKGFEVVLHGLSKCGYNAQWECLQASDFGYPHKRKRLYVIAYSDSIRQQMCIFQPPGIIETQRTWAPTPTYLRMSTERADGYRNIDAIQRGNVVQNFRREICAYGNAVMPVIAEYLFECVKKHKEGIIL